MSEPAGRRVLVIDDTPSIHRDIRRILSRTVEPVELDAAEEAVFGATRPSHKPLYFELDSAYQGRQGVDLVRASLTEERPYALAFVDMRMPPGWNGIETIQEIWAVDPRLQIVICTAHSDYTWDEVLGRLGVEDRLLILKKPFDSIEVAQLASTLTTKWELTRIAETDVRQLRSVIEELTRALEIAKQPATLAGAPRAT